MQSFIITEQQAQVVLGSLLEFPAKNVIAAIDIIRSQLANYDPQEIIILRQELTDMQSKLEELTKAQELLAPVEP